MYPILSRSLFGKVSPKNVTPLIYAADLSGAFVATFVFTIIFVPFLGINLSLLMLIFLTALFALRNFLD
jgi:uncharacterized membrane protein